MKRAAFLLLAAAFVAALPAAESVTLAPAKNWVLPLFTKEGHRSMTARGSEARVASAQQIEVTDLNLTIYKSDAIGQIETIILSPAATFLPAASVARGEKSMRLLRDDLEATGTRWVYDHAGKKVTLDGRVQIVINAQLKDLLK